MENNLRMYRKDTWYNVEDIAEKLLELSNLKGTKDDVSEDLKNALYDLKAIAQNKYNSDHYRTLYNVLLIITGLEIE